MFGRGWYTTDGNELNGIELYIISNAGYSNFIFNFTRVSNVTWLGQLNGVFGPLSLSSSNFTMTRIDYIEPEEEFCTRPSPKPNQLWGLWEWLELRDSVFHHTKGVFNLNSNNLTVSGCWGYSDPSNINTSGTFNGTMFFEDRGWIGTRKTANVTTAMYFLRIGNTGSETKIVGYYLSAGSTDPPGYQILSNSATLGNNLNQCPIQPVPCVGGGSVTNTTHSNQTVPIFVFPSAGNKLTSWFKDMFL